MAYSIPENKIQEVREATDIVDLVSGYVTLKKSGRNFFGLCPFHVEKTPSFSVNAEKQIFHCFGCGAGGNVFTFLMRHEGTSFVETVKFLAQRAGILLELEERDESDSKESEALFFVNEFAARFFETHLLAPEGHPALNYLQERGFGLSAIKQFGLGYAPAGWNNLIKHAQKEAVAVQQLQNAGLVLSKSGGDYYDRFRNRVMFTIRNLSGRVVAFAGRKLDEAEDSPKYINSPETRVYEKGKLLYGLFQNRDEIRKQDHAIFVEGYTDLMSLVSHGVKNVVATSGTALTENQAQLIRRYTRNVVLMYDSDSAGSAATLRGADILLAHGLNVAVARLPDEQDPDSFVRARGAEAVLEFLQQARSLFDFKLEQTLLRPQQQRTEAIRSIVNSLASVKDSIQRSILLRHVAETLQIGEKILWSELEAILHQKHRPKSPQSKMSENFKSLTAVSKKRKIETAAEDLVRILIQHWEMAEHIFSNLELDHLTGSRMLPILEYMKNQFKGGKQPEESDLLHRFHEIDQSDFIVNAVAQTLIDVDTLQWSTDCLNAIKRERIQNELEAVREQIRQAQSSGQSMKMLLERCMELEGKKNALQTKQRA
ncbi:MAG: DNA primase [bacterium]